MPKSIWTLAAVWYRPSVDLYPYSFTLVLIPMKPMCFSHGANIIILFGVIIKALYAKNLFLEGTLPFLVEVVVLDKSLYPVGLQQFIILLASISGIGTVPDGAVQ